MLYITYSLSFVLMIILPILLGIFLARRYRQPWRFFIVGAVTFVLSQIVHIPLNMGLTLAFRQGLLPSPPIAWQLPFNAIVLGLTAGMCEELARYFILKYSLSEARSWRAALMFGAGHGGVEAVLLGVLAAIGFVNLVLLKENPGLAASLPADQQAVLQQQLTQYWSAPWYMSLLGAVERVFALTLHLGLSVIVMQVFLRRQWRWLILAIGWHLLVDAVAVYALPTWGVLVTEGIVAITAAISIAIILVLRHPEPPPVEPQAVVAAPSLPLAELEITSEAIERSRYAD